MSDTFLTLTAESVADYVGQNRASNGMWLFHHIPKTAGSSLAAELAVNAGEFLNILPDYEQREIPFQVRLDNAFKRFQKRVRQGQTGEAAPVRSASGHLTSRYVVEAVRAFPQTNVFTFLRHPVNRMISEYSYNCSPAHPPHREFVADFPTFEDFARSPEEQNKMAYYMFGPIKLDTTEALAEMDRRYRMIGLQERYPVSFLLLSSMIWAPSLPKMRERVSGAASGPEIPAAVRARIIESNQLDLALFTAVEQVYARISEAIWQGFRPSHTA